MIKAPRKKKSEPSIRGGRTQRAREPSPVAFALPAECTLAGASELKTHLTPLLSHPASVKLDGSRVRRIDTASLQLLVAFIRDRRANGLPIEWMGQTPTLGHAVNLLGLTAELDAGGSAT